MKRLKSPDNTNLPFFAYGVFKPGQVGYSGIIEFIINRDNLQESEINLSLKQRNGMPMLVEDFTNNTKGYLYYFNDSKAYDIISNSRSRDLFEWKVYEIDSLESNVLIAKDCQLGDDYNYDSDSYEGRNDIGFFPALNYVRDNLPNHNFGSFETFF